MKCEKCILSEYSITQVLVKKLPVARLRRTVTIVDQREIKYPNDAS